MKLMIVYLVLVMISTLMLGTFTNDRRNIVLGIMWPILVLIVVSGTICGICNLLMSIMLNVTEGVKNE